MANPGDNAPPVNRTDSPDEHAAKPKDNAISPATLLDGLGTAKPFEPLKALYAKISENFMPALFIGAMPVPGTRPIYDYRLTPEEEAQKRFPDANQFANATEQADIQNLYVRMRKAQLEHVPVESALSVQDRARLAARTLFPEKDEDCTKGRKLTEQFLNKVLVANKGKPLEAYTPDKEDIDLLAKIDSLRANDHDYLHNAAEILHPRGTLHLPTDFVGIGYDKATNSLVEKTFNLQEILERRTRAALSNTVRNFDNDDKDKNKQGKDKDEIQPDEEANLTFFLQMLRGTMPQNLLEPQRQEQLIKLLEEDVKAFYDRDANLSLLGADEINKARQLARVAHPTAATINNLPGRPLLSDADDLYEFLTLNGDVRRLEMKESLLIQLAGTPGIPREALPKIAELATPDKARLAGFDIQRLANVNMATPEYEKGHVLGERAFIRTVDDIVDSVVAKAILNDIPKGEKTLEDKHLAAWASAHNSWAIAYLRTDPTATDAEMSPWIKHPFLRVCNTELTAASVQENNKVALTRAQREAQRKTIEALHKANEGGAGTCEHLKAKLAPGK